MTNVVIDTKVEEPTISKEQDEEEEGQVKVLINGSARELTKEELQQYATRED